jgi:hypothetical protein
MMAQAILLDNPHMRRSENRAEPQPAEPVRRPEVPYPISPSTEWLDGHDAHETELRSPGPMEAGAPAPRVDPSLQWLEPDGHA